MHCGGAALYDVNMQPFLDLTIPHCRSWTSTTASVGRSALDETPCTVAEQQEPSIFSCVHSGRHCTPLLQVLDEYDRICRPSALDETPCTVAEQREHASLNRYFNVLPFDYNRVRLTVRSLGA